MAVTMFGLFQLLEECSNVVLFGGTAVVAFLVVLAGSWLSRLGDRIAELTGLSSSWIGIILLATITSVPEIVSSVTAVLTGADNIAIGNVFGSNMFNMFIIAILDFLQGPGPVLLTVSATQILPAALGIFLMALAAAGIFATTQFESVSESLANVWGWIFSALIAAAWVTGTMITYRSEQTTVSDEEFFRRPSPRAVRKTILRFCVAALIVIALGILLIGFARVLAKREFVWGSFHFILGESFVGTIIVAFVTSLPELVVSISAYRIGAVNMAIANLFGSNAYNIVIIPIMEVLSGGKSIFTLAQPYHMVTASFAIILTTIAIMGVIYRSRKSFLYLGWDALAIIAFYLLGNYIFFNVAITIK